MFKYFPIAASFITKWGISGSGDGQLNYPYSIAFDSYGNVYISDQNSRVQAFSKDGVFLASWGTFGSELGKFDLPLGIAFDASGNLYVTDSENTGIVNNRIQKFSNQIPQYSLIMKTVGQGSVLPGNGTQNAGATVDLQAIPAAGWRFSGWSGDASGSTNTSITMTGDKTVTATFTQNTYSVTFTATGLTSGTSWNVTLNGNTQSSTTSTITFTLPNGNYAYTINTPATYTLQTPSSTGTITVENANKDTQATFVSSANIDWPMQHHNPANTSFINASGPTIDHILWQISSLGAVYSSAAVVDGVVYINTDAAGVFAYNASTGSQIWTNPIIGLNSSPAVANGIVYVGSANDGNIYALNATNGSELWHTYTGLQVSSSPIIVDNVVYLTDDFGVRALNALTGTEIWSINSPHITSPAVANGIIYFGTETGYIIALNANNGDEIWSYATLNAVYSSPVVADGVVYAGSTDTILYAFNAATGELIWRYWTNGAIHSNPAVANGFVYVGSDDGYLYAINAKDGVSWWTFPTTDKIQGGISVANDIIYFGSDDDYFYAVNATTGLQIWSYLTLADIHATSAISNSVVYISSNDGTLYAFGGQPRQYTLTMNTIGGGTVSPGNSTFLEGGNPIIRATPAQGWSFAGWSGDASGKSTTTTVPGDGNRTVTATFVENTYTLTMKTIGSGSVTPGNITTYHYGDTVDIKAMNANGWYFSGWSGDASGGANTTLTMNANKTVTATFLEYLYNVTFTRSGLAEGTNWSVIFNGTTHSSTTGTIVFNGYPAGTYTYSIATPTNYVIGTASSGIITLTEANITKPVTFTSLASTDWPMFHHNPLHTGAINGTGPLTNQTLWTYTTGDKIQGHPTVANGVIYVGSLDNYIYALDANTGEELWKFLTGDDVISAPAVSNGIVYVGSYDHKVYALNATTGKSIWNYTGNGAIESYPIVDDGVVYVGSSNIAFYALDAYTGSLIWQVPIEITWAGPAICDGIIYLGSLSNYVYALNKTDGTTIWSYTTGGSVNSSPAVVNGVVYVGCEDTSVYALNATTGERIWRYRTNNWVYSSPAVKDGVVYVAAGDRKIYALNAVTGSFIWSQTIGDGIMSSPAVVGGVVYIGSDDYNFYALNATDGSIIWTYLTGGIIYSSPAIADGVLYVGSDDGKIYAFGTPSEYTLTINTIGQGSVSPGNITYPSGTIANLTAIPAAGWSFSGWSGDASGNTNPCTVSIDGNKTITATFTQDSYLLTILTVGQGSVTNSNTTCLSGTTVNLEATANAGWCFSDWTGDITGTDNPASIVMDHNMTVTATFKRNTYILTVITIGDGTVRPANETFKYGEKVDVGAKNANGWSFSGWSGDASGLNPKIEVRMTGNKTITATFTKNVYTLTMLTVGNGDVSPGNMTAYSYGDSVDLQAINAKGWTFAYWTGDASGTTNTTISMTKNMTVTATFTQNTCSLTMLTVGNGEVSPGNASYLSGTSVDLKAMAAKGWSFSGWSGDTSGASNTTITIDNDMTVTATFTQDTYTLTINTIGNGEVSPGNSSYLSGTSVDLKAYASKGWTFKDWIGDASGTTNTTIVMDDDMTVTATFTQNTYTLTTLTIGQGTVTPGNQTYLSGTKVDIAALNAKGWTFKEWSGDASGSDNTTLTMDGDMTVTATFTQNTYRLTIVTVGQGTVSPGNMTYLSGTTVDLQAMNAKGWTFKEWTGDASGSSNSTVVMDGNMVVTATFTQDIYTLTIITVGQGTVTPGNSSYLSGTTVDLKAINATHWAFSGWSGDASGAANTTITLDGNTTIIATFTKITYTVNFALSGVGSDFTGAAITVDGTEYSANALPLSFTWESGSQHSFSFVSTLSVSSVKQYVWASTSGLSTVQGSTLAVTGSGTITGTFNTQYQLTVTSPHGTTSGSGWYTAGTYATAAISSSTVSAGDDTRYLFTGWSGSITDSGLSATILMDGFKTVSADWVNQYFIAITANPVGAENALTSNTWMPAGSLAISAIPNNNYTFTSWTTTGAVTIASSSSNSTTATINGPGTITANFNITNTTTIIATVTTSGDIYGVELGGNVTVNQMSNLTITPHPSIATTTVSFTVTGESGTEGFGNITISKNAIPFGTTPLVYIDGKLAENQGYTEDADNYYIWYTTHFSTHKISIEFETNGSTQPQPQDYSLSSYCLAIGISAFYLAVGFFLVILLYRRRKKDDEENKTKGLN